MTYVYGFTYDKTGQQIYCSHLDALRLLNRAARRAELPVALTEGFHKHLKIKLIRALKLGLEAQGEAGEIILKENWKAEDLIQRWQAQLPQGFQIKTAQYLKEQR